MNYNIEAHEAQPSGASTTSAELVSPDAPPRAAAAEHVITSKRRLSDANPAFQDNPPVLSRLESYGAEKTHNINIPAQCPGRGVVPPLLSGRPSQQPHPPVQPLTGSYAGAASSAPHKAAQRLPSFEPAQSPHSTSTIVHQDPSENAGEPRPHASTPGRTTPSDTNNAWSFDSPRSPTVSPLTTPPSSPISPQSYLSDGSHKCPRKEHVNAFDDVVEEVRQSYANIQRAAARDPNAPSSRNRWATLSKQIIDTLGDERTYATVADYSDITSPAYDVATDKSHIWRLTNAEIDKLIAQGRRFDRTILIPGSSKTSAADFTDFLAHLRTFSLVDVQDLSRPATDVVAHMSTATVVKRINRLASTNLKVKQSSLPLNLLNMEDIAGHVPRVAPPFLSHPRFSLLGQVCARLRDKLPLGGPFTRNPGKRDFIAACETFSIFAQRGAFSGPHCDALVGTWVHNMRGLKAWPITTDMSVGEAHKYEELGSFWQPAPGKAKIVILGEGDTLIMPSGKCIVHCPLTLDDCYMVGGMFWDDRALLDILRGIWWTAKAPVITNEGLSRQMPEVLRVLREIVVEEPWRFVDIPALTKRTGEKLMPWDRGAPTAPQDSHAVVARFLEDFDSIIDRIREEGSCTCCAKTPSTCECRWETCKCRLYRDRCGEWCHERAVPKEAKGEPGNADAGVFGTSENAGNPLEASTPYKKKAKKSRRTKIVGSVEPASLPT